MRRWVLLAVSSVSLAACESKAERADRLERQKLVPIAQGAIDSIKASLIDPASAQFSDVTISNGSILCGKVNAKNRMGGYNGSKSFSYNGIALIEQETPPSYFGSGAGFDYEGAARAIESSNIQLQIMRTCNIQNPTDQRMVEIESQTVKSIGANTAMQAQAAEAAADAAVSAAADAVLAAQAAKK